MQIFRFLEKTSFIVRFGNIDPCFRPKNVDGDFFSVATLGNRLLMAAHFQFTSSTLLKIT